jgi:hypothetical protein
MKQALQVNSVSILEINLSLEIYLIIIVTAIIIVLRKAFQHLIIKVIPYDDNWCRGRINGKDGYVPKTYITEKPHSLV